MLAPSVSTSAPTLHTPAGSAGTGAFLYADDGRALPLKDASMHVEACAGVATVVLTQRFENPYAEPLHVTYLMPLPHDGAVSGYAFLLGERRVVGEVDRKARARERFEEALSEGRTAGLVEEVRANLFTQELGNVPPHATVTAEIRVDQRLTWLAEGRWEWRFPMAAGPRYMGQPGRVPDEKANTLTVATHTLPVTMKLNLAIRDELTGGAPESASHALNVARDAERVTVSFADVQGVPLDRDVVVRWYVARPRLGLTVDVARPATGNASLAAYGLVTLVPPQHDSPAARPLPRDVCLLLDISGSMSGEPLAQVKRVCERIVDELGPQDRLEMVAFSSRAMRFAAKAELATVELKRRALGWLEGLRAGGGTEMVEGIVEALAPLGSESQRQVVLLTDGYVGFENEVTRTIAEKLPPGSRFHVVGVGSAVNRALTRPSARAGRGVELIVAPGEDAGMTCQRLLARLNAPVAMDVRLDGDALLHTAPQALPDVYAGSPMIAAVKLRTDGGLLRIRARTVSGEWEETVRVPAVPLGEGPRHVAALYAREAVEDLELREACAPSSSHAREIEQLGLDFQIATAHTTWVAISDEITVDPTRPSRHQAMPQMLPHGVSAEGVGLRAAAAPSSGGAASLQAIPADALRRRAAGAPMGAPPPAKAKKAGFVERLKEVMKREDAPAPRSPAPAAPKAPPPAASYESDDEFAAPAEMAKQVRRILRGIIRLLTPQRLTLAVDSPSEGMDWVLPTTVTIRLASGRTVQATVDAAQSTRAGNVVASLQVKLVLDVTEDLRQERVVSVACEAWEIHVGA
ncbi:MAG: VIT domain-containing protein [Myxococcota bacterium]